MVGNFRRLGAVLAAVGLTAAAEGAHAAILTATWRGYVQLGTDTGVYLPSGGNLAGLPFTYRVTIDDATTTPYQYSSPGQYSSTEGGSHFYIGDPSPASGVMTIGGVSSAVTGDYVSVVSHQVNVNGPFFIYNHGTYQWLENRTDSFNPAIGLESYTDLYIVDYGHSISVPWDYRTPASFLLPAGLAARGGFTAAYVTRPDGSIAAATAELIATSYTMAAGVPEPGSWGLMLLGLGGVGAMARRAPRLGRDARTS